MAETLAHDPAAVYRIVETTLWSRQWCAGEGLPQGPVRRAGGLQEVPLEDRVVYGFKVALVVDPAGVVTAFGLAPADCDERPIGDALIASDHHETYLADKGFSSPAWERGWLKAYGGRR